jgi:competence protein ComEC
MLTRRWTPILLATLAVAACAGSPADLDDGSFTPGEYDMAAGGTCSAKNPLRVHFYSVGMGLAALVDLPDGRHILVDAGDGPDHGECGQECVTAHQHLMDGLRTDLAGKPIDLMWITHQHMDHIAGAADVLNTFKVLHYVDNGRIPTSIEVAKTHQAAQARGTAIGAMFPGSKVVALASSTKARITPMVPSKLPRRPAALPSARCSPARR